MEGGVFFFVHVHDALTLIIGSIGCADGASLVVLWFSLLSSDPSNCYSLVASYYTGG